MPQIGYTHRNEIEEYTGSQANISKVYLDMNVFHMDQNLCAEKDLQSKAYKCGLH